MVDRDAAPETVRTNPAGIVDLIVQASRAFARHDMSTYAAALAYHTLFSLFPFIIFFLALLSYLNLAEMFTWIRGHAQLVLPPSAMAQLNLVLIEVQVPKAGLLSTGAALSLWLSSRGVRALMNALNVAYGAAESRPGWKRIPLSIAFTLALVAMLIAAALLMTIGPRALQWLSAQIGLKTLFVITWTWMRWPAVLVLLMVGVASVYYAAPNVAHRFQLLSVGSALSVTAWITGSIGFSYYVEHFSSYSVIYGSLGAVIVLLLYLYLSAAVLLFGAEINAVIAHNAAPDLTTVPDSAVSLQPRPPQARE
ncbi:MAG: YihY/virulence factor BrkB family protein [Herminiimonas sp.]|nr:YihY/virulence factor BrkB family protein [Herminiimonas sp.]